MYSSGSGIASYLKLGQRLQCVGVINEFQVQQLRCNLCICVQNPKSPNGAFRVPAISSADIERR